MTGTDARRRADALRNREHILRVAQEAFAESGAASFTFRHVITEKDSGRVIVTGSARLAATDGNGKVKRLDKATAAALQS